MKKGGGKNKGNQFERDFCKRLSLWWSNGESDSVFWRTSNSGGRATVRSSKGQRTENQYDDVCAVEESGRDFMRLFTIELKRGYNRHSLQDLIDSPDPSKTVYGKWIAKVIDSQRKKGAEFWMLAIKRDRREIIVISNFLVLDSHHLDWFNKTLNIYVYNLDCLLRDNFREYVRSSMENTTNTSGQ